MNLRICLLLFSISTVCFSQIKKQEHKELRSKKEIEKETVLQKITENIKNNYHFSKTDFYNIATELKINSKLFYAFQGICKLQTITPIDCESKYSLDKEKFEANKESEDKIFKGERNPRNNKPFYLTSVFEQLENIFKNYQFFSKTDYTFNLIENNDNDFYHLSFRSKNEKLPIVGTIILHKNNYTPKSLEYTIYSNYTFEMSTDNFNHSKSKGYAATVVTEIVSIEFQKKENQFMVSKYQSEFEFLNEQNTNQEKINGDNGHSKITLEIYEKEPKICHALFDLNTLSYKN